MKALWYFFLFYLITIPALADQIICYSNGTKIYKGIGKDFLYQEGIFIFTEVRTNKVVFISGDCVVKIDAY